MNWLWHSECFKHLFGSWKANPNKPWIAGTCRAVKTPKKRPVGSYVHHLFPAILHLVGLMVSVRETKRWWKKSGIRNRPRMPCAAKLGIWNHDKPCSSVSLHGGWHPTSQSTPFLSRWDLHESSKCSHKSTMLSMLVFTLTREWHATLLGLSSRQQWSQRCSQRGGICKSGPHLLPFYSLRITRVSCFSNTKKQWYPMPTSVTLQSRSKQHTSQSQQGRQAESSWSLKAPLGDVGDWSAKR